MLLIVATLQNQPPVISKVFRTVSLFMIGINTLPVTIFVMTVLLGSPTS